MVSMSNSLAASRPGLLVHLVIVHSCVQECTMTRYGNTVYIVLDKRGVVWFHKTKWYLNATILCHRQS